MSKNICRLLILTPLAIAATKCALTLPNDGGSGPGLILISIIMVGIYWLFEMN